MAPESYHGRGRAISEAIRPLGEVNKNTIAGNHAPIQLLRCLNSSWFQPPPSFSHSLLPFQEYNRCSNPLFLPLSITGRLRFPALTVADPSGN
jgi:hypothetical protein